MARLWSEIALRHTPVVASQSLAEPSNEAVASNSFEPVGVIGHQARLPIESAWPSRTRHSTISGAVTPSPGISSDDFDFPRLPIVHMRAVWSSEAEAIRVREVLNLI